MKPVDTNVRWLDEFVCSDTVDVVTEPTLSSRPVKDWDNIATNCLTDDETDDEMYNEMDSDMKKDMEILNLVNNHPELVDHPLLQVRCYLRRLTLSKKPTRFWRHL